MTSLRHRSTFNLLCQILPAPLQARGLCHEFQEIEVSFSLSNCTCVELALVLDGLSSSQALRGAWSDHGPSMENLDFGVEALDFGVERPNFGMVRVTLGFH